MNTAPKFSFISTSIITAIISSQAHADMQSGKDWLSTQNANNSNNSNIANPLQNQQETAQTLQLLQTNLNNSTNIDELLKQESSTEGLVRIILLLHTQDQTSNPSSLIQAWQTLSLNQNQNEDGGFAHIQGWQSNPLDTAFVLIALHQTNYLDTLNDSEKNKWQTRIAKSLAYLASQQQTEGNYSIAHLDDLYTSSYVLSAITPYIKDYGQYIPTTQKLVAYLESKQVAPATWSTQESNKGLFLDALVAESLYPYQNSDDSANFAQAFEQRALSLQNSDGSWQEDGYVTALVLRSLDKLAKPVNSPISSSISLTVTDGETGLPLQGAILTSSSNSPSQIQQTTNNHGQLIAKDSNAGQYQFTLSREGYNTINFEISLKQGEQLNIKQLQLSRKTSTDPNTPAISQLQGMISENKTNTAIANAQITVVMTDDNGQALPNLQPVTANSNSQGNYQIILPQAGKFSIRVAKDGYLPITATGKTKAGQTALFNPKLTNQADFSASITGKVIDTTGQILNNVNILQNDKIIASTDNTGTFTLNNLSKGNQQLSIAKQGYLGVTSNIAIQQSGVYDVGTIVLEKQSSTSPATPAIGTIKISAIDNHTQKELTGIIITAEKLDSNNKVTQTQSFLPESDNTTGGTLTLPAGKWKVTISHPAYNSVNRSFVVKDKQQLNYQARLRLKPYTLSGKVVDSQTDKAIANAPVTVLDSATQRKLYTGKTDDNGYFAVDKAIRNSIELEVIIDPALYLSTKRFVIRNSADQTDNQNNNNNLDMGEIRLRPKSAQIVLPDLAFTKTDTSQITTNQQTLEFTGQLTATLTNKGNATLYPQDIVITAFEDKNNNRKLDKDEVIYGKTRFNKQLAKDDEIEISLDIAGKADFREAPIAIMVDSEEQVAEKDEGNNVRLTSDGVEIKPQQGTLDAEVVWQVNFRSDSGAVASPLEDTDGDGKIGQGDIASIIVYSSRKYRVLNGQTGVEKFTLPGHGSQELASIADLDNDGVPEIVVKSRNGMNVYSNTGNLIKTIDNHKKYSQPSGWSSGAYHPNIADLDKDGMPEIIINDSVYNFTTGTSKKVIDDYVQAVADVNQDGYLDLITRTGAFDREGKKLYDFKENSNKKYLKFLAVGDVLGNKQAQIISIIGSQIYIFDASTGQILSKYNAPSSAGGSPVIADFDGDGITDIGLARTYNYVAMRGDGSVIWATPINDGSGGTGSTVFDFDNDGKMEAVHFDERYLRIYDAQTGKERIKIPNSTSTAHEYPIVGDFDADGHADIVITSGGHGTRMISSKNKDWANTRNIWNQYSYHVTNINDDLSIPKNEPNSWEVHNTYRANLLLNQNATAASDLTAAYIRVEDNSLTNSTFTARIGNAGGKPVPAGTPISFYRIPQTGGVAGKPEFIGTVALTKTLVGGNIAKSYEDITLEYNGSLADFGELVVVANDAGAGLDSATGVIDGTQDITKVIQEYTRSNNVARLAIDGGWTALTLDGNLDNSNYTANTDVTITAIPSNLGSFPTSPTVKTEIIDSAGNIIATLPTQQIDLTSALIADPDNSKTLKQTWNTASKPTGNYIARISLWKKSSIFSDKLEQVTSIDRPFTIVADNAELGITDSQISTDKASYTPNDIVQINSRIANNTSNQMASRRNILVEVKDDTGKVIFSQDYSYDELVPNALKEQAFELSLNDTPAGNYTVTQTTTAPDGSQQTQINSTNFVVADASQTGIGITGSIHANKPQIELGETITLNWTVNNTADLDLSQLPLRIELFRNDEQTAFGSISIAPEDIAKGTSLSKTALWQAIGNDQDKITAILVASFKDPQGKLNDKGLASTSFALIEPPIEVTINQQQNTAEPLLVYYSCVEGWKTHYNNSSNEAFDFPCYDQRANTLRTFLDRQQIPYRLVKKPSYFADQLQSGLYKQVWLLGSIQELRPHTRKELTETTHIGNGLVMDSGMNSWLNNNLVPLAGAKVKHRLLLDDKTLMPMPSFTDAISQYTTDTISTSTPLIVTARSKAGHPYYGSWALQLQPKQNANVWAKYTGKIKRLTQWRQNQEPSKDYPAIISQKYGKSEPVILAFDFISTLESANNTTMQADDSHWDAVISTLLEQDNRQPPADYVPHEVINIPLSLTNKGNKPQTLTVTIDLPTGARWLDNQGGLSQLVEKDNQPTQVAYQVTLSSKQQKQQSLTLRLPTNSGTHNVRVTISNSKQQTLAQQEMRYLVRDIDSRINLLSQVILDEWNVLGVNGMYKLNAKTNLTNIKTHRWSGAKQLAVYESARLANQLRLMQQKDNSVELQQLRYEADELLKALQIDWYMARDGFVPLL